MDLPQPTLLYRAKNVGQPWPQSTLSIQSPGEQPLTLTAPFPAGISSSDEESSSSLLSTLTAEFVTRARLAAARRGTRKSGQSL